MGRGGGGSNSVREGTDQVVIASSPLVVLFSQERLTKGGITSNRA